VLRRAEVATLEMLSDCLPTIMKGSLRGRPQEGEASYSLQRHPSDGVIDWRLAAKDIARLVRSVSRPYPGALAALDEQCLTIWRARVADRLPRVFGMPGQIVRLPELPVPAVVCGVGLLLVEKVEGPHGFDVDAFANCHQRRLDVSV